MHAGVDAHGGGHMLRRWFCGLPSATPYCQAGIFHGENAGIPAFRFYDKAARKVITCNAPHGVQYIRDRIHSPGALAGGSSYVNLLDGDASTVARHLDVLTDLDPALAAGYRALSRRTAERAAAAGVVDAAAAAAVLEVLS